MAAGGSGWSVVNRAYYAAFYAVLALLQTISKAPKKHQEAISIFDREFVKTGEFEKQQSKDIHWLFDRRMSDDYDSVQPVLEEEQKTALEKARSFVDAVRKHIRFE